MKRWKSWEGETRTLEYEFSNGKLRRNSSPSVLLKLELVPTRRDWGPLDVHFIMVGDVYVTCYPSSDKAAIDPLPTKT